ncbi:MAG: WecB/TagA/CpsF family glycosyltransferase [Deltaproteobacteria bacterium]|nr:WecB/TagA/CpsF family glycosyltransferase [Deltaproteobacteria bacterium]
MIESTSDLLGLDISRLGLDEAVAVCRARIKHQRGGYACFVNAHTATLAIEDSSVRAALNDATFRFADGMPLLWLAKLKRTPVTTRVAGPDFMRCMLESEPRITHGFIGGEPGRGEAIARRFGVHAVSYSPPMREFSEANALEDWRKLTASCADGCPPAIVWVGLGAPKQERWAHAIAARAPQTMFFAVGAAFEFLSGNIARAPAVMQRNGLEWAYRLAIEPRRLWRRYLSTNTRFVALAIRDLWR